MTSLCSAKVILGLTPLQNLFRRIKAKRRDYQHVASLNILVLKTVGSLIHTVCLYENRIVISGYTHQSWQNENREALVCEHHCCWTVFHNLDCVWTKQHADNYFILWWLLHKNDQPICIFSQRIRDHFPWKKQFYLPVFWFNLNIKAARYSQF